MAYFEPLKERVKPLVAEMHERFGVDEARKLIERASLKNFVNTTFLIAAASMTTEAQQALLKLFEEPQPGTTFILLVPHGIVLPTLRSRMLEYPEKLKPAANHRVSKSDIAALLKEDDKERVREFLNALEVELHAKVGDPRARQALEDIAMARDYLRDRSPSLKMLLEHLALVI